MISSFPGVFYCTLLNREADRDDCHECRLGVTCAGIPSRLMLINRQAPVGPTSGPQYPPPFRGLAKVGVSGQREKGDAGTGAKGRDFFSDPPQPPSTIRPRPAPQAQGVRDE